MGKITGGSDWAPFREEKNTEPSGYDDSSIGVPSWLHQAEHRPFGLGLELDRLVIRPLAVANLLDFENRF